jgi:hypothetical protein
MSAGRRLLDGIRVLELAQIVAGPSVERSWPSSAPT